MLTILAIGLGAFDALARGTAFPYQGRLIDGGVPANGTYDMQFTPPPIARQRANWNVGTTTLPRGLE